MDWRPLDVTVISAAGIKNVNYFYVMDVYVEVSILGYAKNTKRTFIDKKGGTNPKWNYPMKFTLDEPSLTKPGLSLCFRLRSDRIFGDKDIGIFSIPISEIFSQSACGPDGSIEKIVEYQVFTPKSGKPKGNLKFSFKFGKKYEQPSELMYKNVNPPNYGYNENLPVTAYPFAKTGTNNMSPPSMGYGMPNPNHAMTAYHEQPAGYPPVGYNAGGYPPAGYPPTGYPQAGYGYPPQQQQQAEYGYPPQQQQQAEYGYPPQQQQHQQQEAGYPQQQQQQQQQEAGYGYPQQQQQQQQVYGGYPSAQQVQMPQKKSKLGMGAGVGLGLAGGLLGGMVVGKVVSDVADDMDDAMSDMDY